LYAFKHLSTSIMKNKKLNSARETYACDL